jgi:hypothetical protein
MGDPLDALHTLRKANPLLSDFDPSLHASSLVEHLGGDIQKALQQAEQQSGGQLEYKKENETTAMRYKYEPYTGNYQLHLSESESDLKQILAVYTLPEFQSETS